MQAPVAYVSTEEGVSDNVTADAYLRYHKVLQLSRLWLEYFRFVVGILRSPGESSEAELLLT